MLKILHIEDNLNDHKLLVMGLKKLIPDVIFSRVETSDEAFDILHSESFDCIICDFQIPGLNGVDFIKNLRYQGDTTPLILLTGEGNEAVAAAAFRMGANDYFAKGDQFAIYDRLLNSIENSIRNRQNTAAVEGLETRFNALTHNGVSLVYEWIIENQSLQWFGSFEKALGYSKNETPDKVSQWLNIIHPEDVEPLKTIVANRDSYDHLVEETYRIKARNGEWHYWEDRGILVTDISGKPLKVVGIVHDVTDRETAREHQQRLSRAYDLLAKCNSLMIRCTNEQDFMQGLADLFVSRGRYRLAWIGKADTATRTIVPVAMAGQKQDYIHELKLDYADSDDGHILAAEAIRTGKLQTLDFTNYESANKPWQKAALERGLRMGIALPLLNQGEVFGTITLYSSVSQAISEEEKELLMELANDAGYAIQSLKLYLDYERIQLELSEKDRLLQETEKLAKTGSYKFNLTSGELFWTDNLYRILGYQPNSLQPTSEIWEKHIHEADVQTAAKIISSPENHEECHDITYRIKRTTGEVLMIRDRGQWKSSPDLKEEYLAGTIQVLEDK
jgi:PAS domain S-box-containing protein